MTDPVIPKEWIGEDDGERWTLTVENDCMEPGAGEVVTVGLENWESGDPDHPDRETFSLACLTSTQAREVASALQVYAFFVDKANRKPSDPAPTQPSGGGGGEELAKRPQGANAVPLHQQEGEKRG